MGRTVRSLRRIAGVREVVVVDDGSTDATAWVASRAGARLVRLSRSGGKASALYLGARAARGDVLLLADADLAESAGALADLCGPVVDGQADVVVGVPGPGGDGGIGLVRAVAGWGSETLGGTRLAAPLCGQRALRAAVAPWLLSRAARGYGIETYINVQAGRRRLRVVQRPIQIGHRRYGRGPAGWLHRARQLGDVLVTLVQLAGERTGR